MGRSKIEDLKSKTKAKIEQFEEMPVWQEARERVRKIGGVSSRTSFSRDFGLRDQIRRAAVSVMLNIAEGLERESDKEFVGFLYMAKPSASEVRSQLYVALDLNYIDYEICTKLRHEAEAIAKQLSGSIKYLSPPRDQS